MLGYHLPSRKAGLDSYAIRFHRFNTFTSSWVNRNHSPSIHAGLSPVSHRNDVVSLETELVTEHRNRPHSAYAGGQQIPAVVFAVEA